MERCLFLTRRLLRGLRLLPWLLLLPLTAAHADARSFDVFFGGQGSLVFDSGSGAGAWTGTLDESPFPVVPSPLGLLSVVSFSFDAAARTLTGGFEFTSAGDFATVLLGRVDGELLAGDFASGGQLSLDYTIDAGLGRFAGARGFGLSLLDFAAPVQGFSDYGEAGVLVFAVPEPAGPALAAAALLALLATRRRVAPLN
jgi:hypothetical protein